MTIIIPLVCKILEQGPKGKVFVPPNPWVMTILRLLIEIDKFSNLIPDLKGEIEALFKILSVNPKGLQDIHELKFTVY